MFDDEEAIWLDEETEKGIHEIVETAETQAEWINKKKIINRYSHIIRILQKMHI